MKNSYRLGLAVTLVLAVSAAARAQVPEVGASGPAGPVAGEIINPYGIRPGDTVYQIRSFAPDRLGEVLNIFPNGEAQVCFGGRCNAQSAKDVSLGQLSKSQTCLKDICVDNLVMNSRNRIVLVRTVFPNGKVMVRYAKPTRELVGSGPFRYIAYSNKLRMTEADRLTRSQDCFENICVKGMIMDNHNKVGIVKAVFPNGKIGVRYGSGNIDVEIFETWKVRDARHLVPVQEVRCLGDICVHDTVKGPSGKVGWVRAMYSNGKARVDFGGSRPMVEASTLVEPIAYPK